MKKKLFVLGAALVLLLSLAACGGQGGGRDSVATDQMAPSAPMDANGSTSSNFDMSAAEMGWDIAAPEEAPMEPSPDVPAGGGNVPSEAKIIYTADMDLETKEFDEAQKALEAVVQELGGYFESRSVNQGGQYRSLSCTVRMPVENFTTFLDRAGEAAHVTNRSEYLEDVSEAYYDQETRLATQRIKLERLQELLGKAEDMADIITIESAISETELEIEYLTGSLRKYDSQINFSTVNLYLREVYRLSTDEEVPVTFGDRLSAAFSRGLSAGVANLDDLAIFVARNWLTLLLFAVLVAVVVLLLHRRRRRKAERSASVLSKAGTMEKSAPKTEKTNDPEKKE